MSEDSKAAKKKEKKKPENLVIPPPKPKLSKAERRALQEQQRAAKAAAQQQKQQGKKKAPDDAAKTKPTSHQTMAPSKQQPPKAAAEKVNLDQKTVSLVSHLTPYQDPATVFQTGATLQPTPTKRPSSATSSPQQHPPLHPAVLQLGYNYATGAIRGGNARCRAMLDCYRRVLQDYHPPTSSSKDIRQALDHDVLKPAFHYWTEQCRPHSVSMGNAFTFFKAVVASLDRFMTYDQVRETLCDTLEAYARERIEYADRAISDLVCQKVLQEEGEVVMTYGYSEVLAVLLQKAAASKKHFRVIVVDSRPLLEGRKLLHCLRQANIECSYILLNALTYVMQDVTKVLLGASALMSDGSVLGRVGTACVALAAHAQNIPVLICSETYKISNRVQLESITHNELGNPESLVVQTTMNNKSDEQNKATALLADWKQSPNLKLLNLLYDLTPASFVRGIVTELGIVPPTSIAVLLREMNPQDIKSN